MERYQPNYKKLFSVSKNYKLVNSKKDYQKIYRYQRLRSLNILCFHIWKRYRLIHKNVISYGRTLDDVEWLHLNNRYLPIIPLNLADFFKNLNILWIENSLLTSISSRDLRPFPRLVYLNLLGNQLTYIDGNLFMYTPLLQVVDFDSNWINQIEHGLVTNLNDLTQLSFLNNVCINQEARGRSAVISLAAQLSVFCPIEIPTTTGLPTTTTTWRTEKPTTFTFEITQPKNI